jgi:hypothetical protein
MQNTCRLRKDQEFQENKGGIDQKKLQISIQNKKAGEYFPISCAILTYRKSESIEENRGY